MPTQINFLEDHILAPKRCCALKFLHVLENDQILLPYPLPEMGRSTLQFFKRGSKTDLNFSKYMP